MSRWFRFYDDSINDAKLLRLSDELFRAWVTLLCLASKHDGILPALEDIALTLRVKRSKVDSWVAALHSGGLLDLVDSNYAPHNWSVRQFKSDVSTERVQRYRNNKRNVSETPSETAPDTEQKQSRSEQKAPSAAVVEKKSRRKPKLPIPDGYTFPQSVRDYARAKWAFDDLEIDREMPKFIRHARVNDRRCADWSAAAENWFDKAAEFAGKSQAELVDQKLADDGYLEVMDDEALQAWDRFRMAKEGKTFPRNKRGGWRFPSKYPPGYEPPAQTVNAPPIAMQAMS